MSILLPADVDGLRGEKFWGLDLTCDVVPIVTDRASRSSARASLGSVSQDAASAQSTGKLNAVPKLRCALSRAVDEVVHRPAPRRQA
jgi:hypothetical protein